MANLPPIPSLFALEVVLFLTLVLGLVLPLVVYCVGVIIRRGDGGSVSFYNLGVGVEI